MIENGSYDFNYSSVPDKKFYRFPKIEKEIQKSSIRKTLNMNQSADMKQH